MARKTIKLTYQTLIFLISLPAIMLMSGCEDEEPEIYDFSPVSEDFMQVYVTYTHLFFYIDQMAKSVDDSLTDYPGGSYMMRGGTVTVDPAAPGDYPKAFVVDFGSTGTNDIIGGKITGTISAPYLTDGSGVEYELDSLVIHNDRPLGTCFITNKGISSGKILFEFLVPNSRLIRDFSADSAYPVSFGGNQQVLWSESSDVITMPSGSFEGQALRYDSLRYTAVIDPSYKLIKEADCSYIRDGIFDFRVRLNQGDQQVGDGVVDFGFMNPSDCDEYAIAVVDGEANRTEFVYLMEWVVF